MSTPLEVNTMPGRFPAPLLASLLPALGLLAGTGSLAALEDAAEPLATITVDAGESDRVDTPVSVELPRQLRVREPMALSERRDGEFHLVPCQVEHGDPPRLWWVLPGKTRAGSKRRFELRPGVVVRNEGVKLDLTPTTLDVSYRGARLFSYNHAHVPPPAGVGPEYIRSGYIEPMFSPSGMQVTEDFPSDHYHHKGIWFPYTRTRFDGHDVDFWNLGKKQGTVQFAGFQSIENGPVYGRFRVKHEHVDLTQGGKTALNELWDVRVWAVGGSEGGYWLWDLTSTQRCASDSPLHLLRYRYGGLGFRGASDWKGDSYRVLSSEGKTKKDGHTTRSKWCAHSGAIGGKWSTVVVMCHPRNERFPEPMRIWASGGCFFNYAPVQAADWTFRPGETHVFRYRFFVHEGEIDAARTELTWNDFGQPPRATLSLNR